MKDEVARLREGEEDGYVAGTVPTAGQLLKRLHDAEPAARMEYLESLIGTVEMARRCQLDQHDAIMEEGRQTLLSVWGILNKISEMCRDSKDGKISTEEIIAIMPESLRRR